MNIRIIPFERLIEQDKNPRSVFAKKWEVCVECNSLEEAEKLKETLAQPEQEPVEWDGKCVLGHCGSPAGCENSDCCRADFTTPPQRKPEQEPIECPYCKNSATLGAVYYDQNCLGCVKRMTVSQTPPPCPTCEALARTLMLDQTYYDAQRKPLTDEQIEMIGDDVANEKLVGQVPNFRLRLARAIEAAHGIKE